MLNHINRNSISVLHNKIIRNSKCNLSNTSLLHDIENITYNNDYRYNRKLNYFYEDNEIIINNKKKALATSIKCHVCKGSGWTLKPLNMIRSIEKNNYTYYSGYNNYYDLCLRCCGTGML